MMKKLSHNEEWDICSEKSFDSLFVTSYSINTIEDLVEFLKENGLKKCIDHIDDRRKNRILVTKRSKDYIDNGGCIYRISGECYKAELEGVQIIIKIHSTLEDGPFFKASVRFINDNTIKR